MKNSNPKMMKREREEYTDESFVDNKEIEARRFLFDAVRFEVTPPEIQDMGTSDDELTDFLKLKRAEAAMEENRINLMPQFDFPLSLTPPLIQLMPFNPFVFFPPNPVAFMNPGLFLPNLHFPYTIPQPPMPHDPSFDIKPFIFGIDNDSTVNQLSSDLPMPLSCQNQEKYSWIGKNIYFNLPLSVCEEFDYMLRESHATKVEIMKLINRLFPNKYVFHANKSRSRKIYKIPAESFEQAFNNIASRRSRLRKTFQFRQKRIILDFEQDENILLRKQEDWLKNMIEDLEGQICQEQDGAELIKTIRDQHGLK